MKVGLKLIPLIKEIRKQRGITQKHAAEQVGVSQQTLSKWEKGESYPDIRQTHKLAKTLFVNVGELYKEE